MKEYKVLESNSRTDFEEKLNRYSSAGWEVIGFSHFGSTYQRSDGEVYIAIIKKEKMILKNE